MNSGKILIPQSLRAFGLHILRPRAGAVAMKNLLLAEEEIKG